MSRVARELREEARKRLLGMTPAERVAEALRLGQRDIADARRLWARLRSEES